MLLRAYFLNKCNILSSYETKFLIHGRLINVFPFYFEASSTLMLEPTSKFNFQSLRELAVEHFLQIYNSIECSQARVHPFHLHCLSALSYMSLAVVFPTVSNTFFLQRSKQQYRLTVLNVNTCMAPVLQRVSTFRCEHFCQLLTQYFVSLKIPSRPPDYSEVSVMNKFHGIRVSRLLHRLHCSQFKANFIHDIFSYVNKSILVPLLFYVNVM